MTLRSNYSVIHPGSELHSRTIQNEGSPFTKDEMIMTTHNKGTTLEALSHAITPQGLHYNLIHYDIPMVNVADYTLKISGTVNNPFTLTFEQLINNYKQQMIPITLECAGNGRGLLKPRNFSVPWQYEAVSSAIWTGVPLHVLLEEAQIDYKQAVDVVFKGLDRGIEGGKFMYYERGLSLEEAMFPEVLVAFKMNDKPLEPQHGYPVRLIVPGWYGMTSVKWLSNIEIIPSKFYGYHHQAYSIRTKDDPNPKPVDYILVKSLMVPPGIPVFKTRERVIEGASKQILQGRAWAGKNLIKRVEVSVDDGLTWNDAQLGEQTKPYFWVHWKYDWQCSNLGKYVLISRATDEKGNLQPLEQNWNIGGFQNNQVQRIEVCVVEEEEEEQIPPKL